MKFAWSLFLLLAPLVAVGQSVKLPVEVRGDKGSIIIISAETADPTVSWIALDRGISLIPSELLKDSRKAVAIAPENGRYRVACVSAKDSKPSEFAFTTVVVGDVPPIPPGPGPNPPDPKPPGPAPIPLSGNRAFIVYETSMALPAMQQSILTGKTMRDYLDTKCVQEMTGEKGYRIWDKDVNASGTAKHWQDVLVRPRQSIPWLVISTGVSGWEGPLPANTQDTIALMEKYFK